MCPLPGAELQATRAGGSLLILTSRWTDSLFVSPETAVCTVVELLNLNSRIT